MYCYFNGEVYGIDSGDCSVTKCLSFKLKLQKKSIFPLLATLIVNKHYCSDVIMRAIVSQITSLTIVYSFVYSDTDERIYQSSASLAFVRGIHRGPVNSPPKWPVKRKMFPFDDAMMISHAVWFIQYPDNKRPQEQVNNIHNTFLFSHTNINVKTL